MSHQYKSLNVPNIGVNQQQQYNNNVTNVNINNSKNTGLNNKFNNNGTNTPPTINGAAVYRSLAVQPTTTSNFSPLFSNEKRIQGSATTLKKTQVNQNQGKKINIPNSKRNNNCEDKNQLHVPLVNYPVSTTHVFSNPLLIDCDINQACDEVICGIAKALQIQGTESKLDNNCCNGTDLGFENCIQVSLASESENGEAKNSAVCTCRELKVDACNKVAYGCVTFTVRCTYVPENNQILVEFMRPAGGCPFLMHLLFARVLSSSFAEKWFQVDTEQAQKEAMEIAQRLTRCFPGVETRTSPLDVSGSTTSNNIIVGPPEMLRSTSG
jgi:hypothetical protein